MSKQNVLASAILAGALVLTGTIMTVGQSDNRSTAEVSLPSEFQGIALTGEGKVTVVPDVLEFSATTEYRTDDAREALAYTSTLMDRLQSELKTLGVEAKDIKTTAVTVDADYTYPNGRAVLQGYVARNSITVKLKDVDAAGDVLAQLQEVGGNDLSIGALNFTVDDPEAAMEEARLEAVKDARKKAEALAAATGQELGEVLYISDSYNTFENSFTNDVGYSSRYDGAVSVPVSPGESDITVTVEVRFDLL